MEVKGKRVAILAEDLYEDPELWYPYYRLQEAGAEVVVVGPQAGATYQSKHGYPVQTDAAAADLQGTDFDAVIVPGGFSPDRMRRSPDMVRLVREAYEAGKVVAAICHGPWVFISTDRRRGTNIVKGRDVTGYEAIEDDMINAGGNWLGHTHGAVRRGNVVTGRVPDDLAEFCREVIKAIRKEP